MIKHASQNLPRRSALFPAACLVFLLAAGACPSESTRPDPKPEPKITLRPGHVNCNYYWSSKRIHVCIKDMKSEECHGLFQARPDFERRADCVCEEPGRKANRSDGMGYVQLSCR